MSYDANFDHTRLNQLTVQLLAETAISGDVLFIADTEDGGVLGATWLFEDDHHSVLKASNFKFMLMELLGTLIRYRASYGFTGTLCGVVHLKDSCADIRWLPEEEVQKLRSAA